MNAKNKFINKNLLVITPSYPDLNNVYIGGKFVKEQINIIKIFFNKIYIISPQPHGVKTRLYINRQYCYDNVYVYYPRFVHIPITVYREKLGINFLKAINKILKGHDIYFDLIHAHFTWPSGYAASLLKEVYGYVKFVLTVHEDRNWFIKEYSSNDISIYSTWKKADAIIRVNKADTHLLQKINSNTYYIPNGYNPQKIYPMNKQLARKKLNIPTNKHILFTVGKIEKRKGYHILVRALDVLINKHRHKNIFCIIGGEGPYKKQLKSLIKKYDLKQYIWLSGFIEDAKLNFYYNAADIFVLPSYSEGNPTVMFEALGAGIPFVGTAVGGVPEIIISDEYGYLTKPGDYVDLANKIIQALEKKWNRDKIVEYAKRFTWQNIGYKIMEIYSLICD